MADAYRPDYATNAAMMAVLAKYGIAIWEG